MKTKTIPAASLPALARFQALSPCASCPYRCDAPLAMWAKSEFDNLKMQDLDPIMGRLFDCHGEISKPPGERGVCVGWLLDQRKRNAPSIQLRIQLSRMPGLLAQFERAHPGGHKLYRSIDAMIEANYPGGKDRPRPTRAKPKGKKRRKAKRREATNEWNSGGPWDPRDR